MIYGLYLSAAGILTNSHRQDVIANNIANAETVGFKRDLSLFQERLTEAQSRGIGAPSTWTDPRLEKLGGGHWLSPSQVDHRQGELEPTGNPLDVAIEGEGYFAVRDRTGTMLTRNGQFAVDHTGRLRISTSDGPTVLDAKGQPIVVPAGASLSISKDGTIFAGKTRHAKLGLFSVQNPDLLVKRGNTLLSHPGQQLRPLVGQVVSETVERSNVDPTTELAELMDAQRQLEANANMIRYQDQTLGRLVNEVGKIG